MRVLNVVGSLARGGAETYIARMAPLLRERGVEVEVCALEAVGPLRAELETAGVPVHGTIYERRSRRSNTLTLFQTVGEIRDLVRARRIEAVHSYLFWADVLAVPGARLAGCPRRIVSRRALHPWRHDPSRFQHVLEQAVNLGATELIANSEAVLRDAERSERFLPRRRGVVYNGVDAGRYRPARGSASGPLRVLTVGALSHRKGQVYAIRALPLLRDLGVEVRLMLVGGGPDRALLEREAADAGGGVEFAGECEDPRPHLERADLFLLPSRQEGFSNALLEAMASALPVVATAVGGNAEALGESEGGVLVPAQDPPAIAAAIAALGAGRARLRALGLANRARVEARFSLERSADGLARWYAE